MKKNILALMVIIIVLCGVYFMLGNLNKAVPPNTNSNASSNEIDSEDIYEEISINLPSGKIANLHISKCQNPELKEDELIAYCFGSGRQALNENVYSLISTKDDIRYGIIINDQLYGFNVYTFDFQNNRNIEVSNNKDFNDQDLDYIEFTAINGDNFGLIR